VQATIASTAATAHSLNFSGCTISRQAMVAGCLPVDDCEDTVALIQGGVPKGYRVQPGLATNNANGSSFTCLVEVLADDNTTVDTSFPTKSFTAVVTGQS
jgi:hypothetical protein